MSHAAPESRWFTGSRYQPQHDRRQLAPRRGERPALWRSWDVTGERAAAAWRRAVDLIRAGHWFPHERSVELDVIFLLGEACRSLDRRRASIAAAHGGELPAGLARAGDPIGGMARLVRQQPTVLNVAGRALDSRARMAVAVVLADTAGDLAAGLGHDALWWETAEAYATARGHPWGA